MAIGGQGGAAARGRKGRRGSARGKKGRHGGSPDGKGGHRRRVGPARSSSGEGSPGGESKSEDGRQSPTVKFKKRDSSTFHVKQLQGPGEDTKEKDLLASLVRASLVPLPQPAACSYHQ